MQAPQSGKEAACGALVNLSAKTDVNKFAIAAAGGLEPLVALLDFGNPEATNTSYECASAALCNLAVNNANRLKIAAAGAIPRLVKVIHECISRNVWHSFVLFVQVMATSPTPEAAEYATHALGSLACEINANATAIVQVSLVLIWLFTLVMSNIAWLFPGRGSTPTIELHP